MTEKNKDDCCDPGQLKMSCCRIDSIVTVDERGQMVLPKDIRERAGIKAGDKLAVVSMDKGDKISCIALFKADEFSGMVKNFLGPVMKDILGTEDSKNG